MKAAAGHSYAVKQQSFFLRGVLVAVLASAICVLPATASATPKLNFSPSSYHAVPLCSAPALGSASCLAFRLVSNGLSTEALRARQRQDAQDLRRGVLPSVENSLSPVKGSYGPENLRSAYTLPEETTAAATQTIALIDAYNAPNVEADLNIFSTQYHLPACTSVNGCFQKVDQEGKTSPLPAANGGWAAEETLDVEMAHGICPQCHIVLVEASSAEFSDIETAVREAVKLGATEISNSYGGEEEEELLGDEAYNHPGIVVTAATGDEGYDNWIDALAEREGFKGVAPNFPASSPDVVAVGGTTLTKNGSTWESRVWDGIEDTGERLDGTGGGCSSLFTAKPWQQALSDWTDTGCGSHRLAADISAVGDPSTGVSVYDSYPDGEGDPTGWTVYGGTSVSTPIVAAEFALAGGAQGVEYPVQTLYENAARVPADLYDVTQGSSDPFNKSGCNASELACTAGIGYDGPSGLGSPVGLGIFSFVAQPLAAPSSITQPTISDKTGNGYMAGDTILTSNGDWSGNPFPHYSYQWQRCNSSGTSCVNISGATSPSYVLEGADIGGTVRSVVTAVNTEGEKSEDSLASPVVAAPLSAAPANTALPTITDSSGNGYHVGDALTATEGTWLGTTPVAYSYQWQRCNSSGGNCSSIVGATASSYVLASADVGFTLRVNVAAENSNGHGSASSAVTPKVTATTVIAPPTNNAKPTILGSPKVGSILSAEHGTWSGATPITYSYQWLDCREGSAPSENSCVAVLVGGTSASYRVTTSDEGNDLAVLVTATNPGGSSSVYSSSTVVVGLQSSLETTASKPVNKTLPTIKGKDKRKSKLTASTGTWTGTAPITYQYQWGLCVKSKRKGKIIVTCRAIKGATKPTLAVSPKYVNDRLRVVVTATNAAGKVSVTSKETGVIKK